MSWSISSFVSISCSSFSSGESKSEFLKSIPCQFVRGSTDRTVVAKWQATVATVYVNEMKAIFYSTIRAFGRREAELITPKRLGFANAIRFQNYLILNQKGISVEIL